MEYSDHAYFAATYAYLGRNEEARTEVAEVPREKPDFSILVYAKQEICEDPTDRAHLLDGIRRAGTRVI
jgi:hypothetical protein